MVNIDTVYQRVLALANKEQRGYITPLEYNLLANQAQLDLFEQYFYDRNQTARAPGNETMYSDVDKMLDEKISVFHANAVVTAGVLPIDLYTLGVVTHVLGVGLQVVAEYNDRKDFLEKVGSPLLAPTDTRPIYIRDNSDTIQVFGTDIITPLSILNTMLIDYVRIPAKVEWGYDVIGEKALHNGSPNKTTHFEHHRSEETKLVMKILELAGVIIQDPGLIQYGDQEVMKKIQQEKQ